MSSLFSSSAPSSAAPDFLAILRALAGHEVEFIVVGGVAAALNGAPLGTFDLDIVHSRAPENLDRLLACLQELDAWHVEHRSKRLAPRRELLALPGHHQLMTRLGPLDVLGTVVGERGYEDLLPQAFEQPLGGDLKVRVLDLAALIAIKEQTGREKDRAVLPVLRRTLEERQRLQQ